MHLSALHALCRDQPFGPVHIDFRPFRVKQFHLADKGVRKKPDSQLNRPRIVAVVYSPQEGGNFRTLQPWIVYRGRDDDCSTQASSRVEAGRYSQVKNTVVKNHCHHPPDNLGGGWYVRDLLEKG